MSRNNANSPLILIGAGIAAGVAFMSWANKPAPVVYAAPAPVQTVAIDYNAVAAAVAKWQIAQATPPAPPAPVAAPPAPPAPPAPVAAPVKKKAPARVVYVVEVPRCGC